MAESVRDTNGDSTRDRVKPPTSATAITGLVLGLVGLLTSWVPFFNNLSFFIALLGAVFAIIGLVATIRRTRSGKALAVAGLICCIVACVAVCSAQQATSESLRQAMNGPTVASTSTAPANTDSASDTDAADNSAASNQDLALGSSVTLSNGLTVTLNSVNTGLVNYDDSSITAINVTYTNSGDSEVSFNVYDWKAQDAQGAQRSQTYYSGDNVVSLGSGTLAAGGTTTGEICFDGEITKALYYSSMLSNTPTASWSLS